MLQIFYMNLIKKIWTAFEAFFSLTAWCTVFGVLPVLGVLPLQVAKLIIDNRSNNSVFINKI